MQPHSKYSIENGRLGCVLERGGGVKMALNNHSDVTKGKWSREEGLSSNYSVVVKVASECRHQRG